MSLCPRSMYIYIYIYSIQFICNVYKYIYIQCICICRYLRRQFVAWCGSAPYPGSVKLSSTSYCKPDTAPTDDGVTLDKHSQ